MRWTPLLSRLAFAIALTAFATYGILSEVRGPYWWLAVVAMSIPIVLVWALVYRTARAIIAPKQLRTAPRFRTPDESAPFELRLAAWRQLIGELHRWIEPYANGDVDVSPLDESGLQHQAEALMVEIGKAYAAAEPQQRARIRELFRRYPHFAWATGVPDSRDARQHVWWQLLRYSMMDRQPDWRDETLTLNEIITAGENAGVKMDELLRDAAAISNDTETAPGVSTRQILIDHAGKPKSGRS